MQKKIKISTLLLATVAILTVSLIPANACLLHEGGEQHAYPFPCFFSQCYHTADEIPCDYDTWTTTGVVGYYSAEAYQQTPSVSAFGHADWWHTCGSGGVYYLYGPLECCYSCDVTNIQWDYNSSEPYWTTYTVLGYTLEGNMRINAFQGQPFNPVVNSVESYSGQWFNSVYDELWYVATWTEPWSYVHAIV